LLLNGVRACTADDIERQEETVKTGT
jgi:hypothetical protein